MKYLIFVHNNGIVKTTVTETGLDNRHEVFIETGLEIYGNIINLTKEGRCLAGLQNKDCMILYRDSDIPVELLNQ